MIPESMRSFLNERLSEQTWQSRLIKDEYRRYLEFGPLDIDRLARLDIEVDKLGPSLVVCMWDEASPIEIGGYLVVDNLAMGRPSMGGIRLLPDVTPAAVHNLARGMTLKNAAAQLPYGGGKAGIVAVSQASPDDHTRIIQAFARLLKRYSAIYLPGPDVGTNDEDMKTIAIENGLDDAVSKTMDMGGNRIDELGAAAGGVVIALEALLEIMPRLRSLSQFANLEIPPAGQVTVLIQGFGAVGAHAARLLAEHIPGSRVTGVSDLSGALYNESGLPGDELFALWQEGGMAARPYFDGHLAQHPPGQSPVKYSTSPDDLLREGAFCLIPAAPVANYLDTDAATRPSITVDRMGRWRVIVEGANTYSPHAARRQARARMEREVYRNQGVMIATDYLVNSGGVIFAAQEHLIKTPESLRVPRQHLGDRQAVNRWLKDHAAEFSDLAETRRLAAVAYRNSVIHRNMEELIDLLVSDPDMLPNEAAERISVRRIAARESDRPVSDLMEGIPSIEMDCDVRQAARLLIESRCPILAVISSTGELLGVVTEWDITQATAQGHQGDTAIEKIMTREVVTAAPGENLLDIVRRLEHHEISAMPVVEGGVVKGRISTDILARRSLLRLLQSQLD